MPAQSVKDASRSRLRSAGDTVSDESILKIAKEIAVKFIEVGRLTPATFDETFKNIHQTIRETTRCDD